jgi:tetratricopeptide (TPR) repeat protein
MKCPHCGTDGPAGASRCATCGAPRTPQSVPASIPGDLDVTGGIPDAGALDTVGAGSSAAGTGTHELGFDVTRAGEPASTTPTIAPRPASTGGSRQFAMLTAGETLGVRYHIIRLLGIGGMGAVYHAWDAELGVAVALKVIRGDIAGDPDAVAAIERQFKRELLLARQVTHKHVVRIHDLGDIDGLKYITMPYVQGADLASMLKESGTLPIPRTLRYVSQIVDGLVAAHEAGVVHRDLKPANIMIDEDDCALIMDFGIAHSSSAGGSNAEKVVGTLAYMAPEQAQAKPTDQRADVYALGMMLREMLVGRKPSGDGQQALADLMARIKDAPPALRTIDEAIPEPLNALVAKCVEPDPANRFQTSAELAQALAALDEHGNLRPLPKLHMSPWRMTVAAVLVVATVGIAAVIVRRTTPGVVKVIDPVSILVADFDNKTGDAVFDGALEQPLTISMEGASFITTYPRAGALRLAKTLANATRLDAASARPVAFREGVKYVLAGSVSSAGGKFQLQVDALDPQSGKAVKTVSATAASKSDVLAAVGTLASKMRSGLGDTTSESAKLAAAETFTAGSIDAMREYSLGQDVQGGGKPEEALAHYQRAIAIDPQFGRAYSGAAVMSFRLGRQAEGDAFFKQALSLMNRMTDREKHRTLGNYYMQVTNNYEKSAEEYQALVNAYPADNGGHNNLAVAHFHLLDFAKAVEEGKRAYQIYPKNAISRDNLALYSMYASDFAAGAALAKQVITDDATVFKAYLPIAMDAVMKGDAAAGSQAYDEMEKVGTSGASLAIIGRADLALYAGDGVRAAAVLKPGIAADVAGKNTLSAALKQVALAEAELAAGRRAQAVDAAHDALKLARRVEIMVPAGRVLLHAGKAAETRALADELAGQLQKQNRAYGKILLADIAMDEKKFGPATDLLREARALSNVWLVSFDMGVAFVEAGAFGEAISEFNACEKRRGEATALFFDDTPTVRYLATLPYWLGRAEEGLQMPTAKSRYENFLSIRKDAAADPLVQDARRRLK